MANNVVGPGAQIVQPVDLPALLHDASEYEYVEVYNPLDEDFQVRVAQEVPVNMPFEIRAKTGLVQTEQDVTRSYGIDLRNPEHTALKYIYNDTVIPAKQSRNFRGNEAQVVVRQLVNEIGQRSQKTRRLLADPTLRRTIEEQVVKKRGSIQELMGDNLTTVQQQTQEAINTSNQSKEPDNAFPEVKRGRPPKAQPA